LGHHYDGLAIDEFAALDAPAVAFDFQPYSNPKARQSQSIAPAASS
jgi:hypothetical protein